MGGLEQGSVNGLCGPDQGIVYGIGEPDQGKVYLWMYLSRG